MCRKRHDGEGKTLRSGIMHKADGSFQVEVRPRGWRESWKLHLGTYPTVAEAHVARDFGTFLRALKEGVSKAGGYHFLEAAKIFEEFERSQDPQVRDLFRNVCVKCVNSTCSAGAFSAGKSKSNGSKDPELKLLNVKSRDGVKEMMGKFKELYPEKFATFMDEADRRGDQVQTLHPFDPGAPPLRFGDQEWLLTNEQWNILGELLKETGDEHFLSTIRHHHHRVQGLAPSLCREPDSDPQVVGNYPPTTLQGIQRTPDSAVDWTNGGPNITPSLSFGTCFSTSSVQQQFSTEVDQRDHNGHHNLQEPILLPAQQKLSNQAFPYLDEVMKVPLPNASLDPKVIDVIDNNFELYNMHFDSGDHCDRSGWDYTQELK